MPLNLLTPSMSPPMPATPKSEFVLLPRTVKLQSGRTRTFTDAELQGAVSAFKNLGRDLVIDYEHQTLGGLPGFEHFQSPDGTAPAAGWVGDAKVTPEGIVATATRWTARASKMLADGEYKYYSPVLLWNGEAWDGKLRGLGPVGLTNHPEINGLSAVAARCSHEQLVTLMKESDMDYKKIIAEMMGLDANAPDEQFATSLKAKWAEAGAAVSASKEVPTLKAKVTSLETELTNAKTQVTEITALRSTADTNIVALKATHAGEVATLKSSHATELSALKGTLADSIVDGLEKMGKIATADKATILEKAKADPAFVITAFKSVPVGAVVPIAKLGITSAKSGAAPKSAHDNVSASKAFQESPPEVQQMHLDAIAYAEQNKCSYTDALRAVMPAA